MQSSFLYSIGHISFDRLYSSVLFVFPPLVPLALSRGSQFPVTLLATQGEKEASDKAVSGNCKMDQQMKSGQRLVGLDGWRNHAPTRRRRVAPLRGDPSAAEARPLRSTSPPPVTPRPPPGAARPRSSTADEESRSQLMPNEEFRSQLMPNDEFRCQLTMSSGVS